MPHKCTACGARFTAVKREKAHLNKEVIAWYTLFAITVAAHIALTIVMIANGVPLSMLYVNVMIKIHDNTLDKDPGPEYICEHGVSDNAFRRLERKYEEENKEEEAEEEEDLDTAFSSDEKKTAQDIFESLTPEQKAVVEYLIGDAIQPHYIFRGLDSDGKPLIFPQPTIRPWDIHPW